MTPEQEETFFAQFDLRASVLHDGVAYTVDRESLLGCHQTDAEGKWFRVHLVGNLKRQLHPPLSRAEVMTLAAKVLQTSETDLENSLDDVAYHLYCTEGLDQDQVHVWPKNTATEP